MEKSAKLSNFFYYTALLIGIKKNLRLMPIIILGEF